MTSKVTIANLAFSELGANRIVSFDDDTFESNLVSAIYDEVVDETINAAPWTSVIRRALLAKEDVDTVFELGNSFALPTDPFCIRVLNIQPGFLKIPYTIEGRSLLTDISSITIRYIARITDPNIYDQGLKQAIVARLVAEMAVPISGGTARQQTAWRLYDAKVSEAKALDSQQGNDNEIIIDDLITVRL